MVEGDEDVDGDEVGGQASARGVTSNVTGADGNVALQRGATKGNADEVDSGHGAATTGTGGGSDAGTGAERAEGASAALVAAAAPEGAQALIDAVLQDPAGAVAERDAIAAAAA